MPLYRIGDLDIDQDLAFQRKEWRVQRGARLVGLLVLLLALTGLFGGGPLAQASVSDPSDLLTVEYDRIDRRHSPSTIRLNIQPAGTQSVLVLWFDNDFFEGVQIESSQPEASLVVAGTDRTILEFSLEEPSRLVSIDLHIEQQNAGLRTATIGMIDGPTVEFRQLVFP